MTDRLVRLVQVSSRLEGDVIVAKLEEEGIGAIVYADDGGGMVAPMVHMQPVEVRVMESDLDEARMIVGRGSYF
ncbi:MAG TPA: DUF2007 domain-containing protein [Acidimicrobiia bacterium]|nr:DUF2007 domain-containing protein [Acidimicrobiia bacterium]